MKLYKRMEEVLSDVTNGVLELDRDVKFAFQFSADFSLKIAGNISARNISAGDISAENISAWNITAGDISAENITAWNISASGDITAAGNISAENISAENIRYYAVCFAYKDIVCLSITGKRDNCRHFCLDGKIELKKWEDL